MSVAPRDYRDHDLVFGLDEGVNHVAAEVAGPAGDQDRHVRPHSPKRPVAFRLFTDDYLLRLAAPIKTHNFFLWNEKQILIWFVLTDGDKSPCFC
jgi:hypothetical protein